MHLFITGATGFLGSHVVDEARRRGHEITALTRRVPTARGDVRWVEGDICGPDTWAHALRDTDAVVHLAMVLDGDDDHQLAVAADGTRNLVDAMAAHAVERLVLVSSLAVYDHTALRAGEVLDEATPLETRPEGRDGYTRAKLAQEAAAARAPGLTILRPGLIWDREHRWGAGSTVTLAGRVAVTIGPWGRMPLTHVDNCAAAVVSAAERPDGPAVANIIDDDCPTRAGFAEMVSDTGYEHYRTIAVPYRVAERVVDVVSATARAVGMGNRLPGLARPGQFAARCKPLRYANTTASSRLGWVPRGSIADHLRA